MRWFAVQGKDCNYFWNLVVISFWANRLQSSHLVSWCFTNKKKDNLKVSKPWFPALCNIEVKRSLTNQQHIKSSAISPKRILSNSNVSKTDQSRISFCGNFFKLHHLQILLEKLGITRKAIRNWLSWWHTPNGDEYCKHHKEYLMVSWKFFSIAYEMPRGITMKQITLVLKISSQNCW